MIKYIFYCYKIVGLIKTQDSLNDLFLIKEILKYLKSISQDEGKLMMKVNIILKRINEIEIIFYVLCDKILTN